VAVGRAFFRIGELRHDGQAGKRANGIHREQDLFDVGKSFENVEIDAALLERQRLLIKNIQDLLVVGMARLHTQTEWPDRARDEHRVLQPLIEIVDFHLAVRTFAKTKALVTRIEGCGSSPRLCARLGQSQHREKARREQRRRAATQKNLTEPFRVTRSPYRFCSMSEATVLMRSYLVRISKCELPMSTNTAGFSWLRMCVTRSTGAVFGTCGKGLLITSRTTSFRKSLPCSAKFKI